MIQGFSVAIKMGATKKNLMPLSPSIRQVLKNLLLCVNSIEKSRHEGQHCLDFSYGNIAIARTGEPKPSPNEEKRLKSMRLLVVPDPSLPILPTDKYLLIGDSILLVNFLRVWLQILLNRYPMFHDQLLSPDVLQSNILELHDSILVYVELHLRLDYEWHLDWASALTNPNERQQRFWRYRAIFNLKV